MEVLGAILLGYLLGSINFAVAIARKKGVDLFAIGSGNPGATNVKRTMGSFWGNTVFILDFLKGVFAVVLSSVLFSEATVSQHLLGIFGLTGAILGHSFSLFLKFKGGKGVATAMGGLLALMPLVLVIGVIIWLLVYYASKIVALASIAFALSLPISAFQVYALSDSRFVFCAILSVLIIIRHQANIRRMLSGKENSFKP